MLHRKKQTEKPIYLAQKWITDVQELLGETYSSQLSAIKKSFQVHGLTYPGELFLTFSLLDSDNDAITPLTYIVSYDLKEGEDPESATKDLIDSAGVFFDTYFTNPDDIEYLTAWQEATYKKTAFYYIVSRENISITIKANKLLDEV